MKKTIGRDLPNGEYVEIEAEEHDSSGTHSPGFAITVAGWASRAAKKRGKEPEYFGGVSKEVLEIAPEVAPLVRAHLSDPDGTPIHAEVNGWYFYSGKAAEYERREVAAGKDYGYSRLLETSDHDRAARALHVDPVDLPTGLDRRGFAEFCQTLKGEWAKEATEAREALESMIDGQGVERVR